MPKPAPKRAIPWRLAGAIVFWTLILAGAAWAAKEAQHFVLTDAHFNVDARDGGLTLRGVHYASRTRILQVFARDLGVSAFHLPLAERRRRLLAVDWVEDASITRLWPNRVVVRIRERKPVAFVHLPSGRYLLIDAKGVLLSAPPRVRFNFPVLNGITGDETEAERSRRIAAMQAVLTELGPAAKQVSEIDAANLDNLRLTTQIDGHSLELWMGDRNFASRYQHFIANYPEIHKTSEGASLFDLRLDDRITTR